MEMYHDARPTFARAPPLSGPAAGGTLFPIIISLSHDARGVDMLPAEPSQHLNPDAGDHEITDDPRELEAAVRAGDRSWSELPYYEWRYGGRGRRFGHSDSAWLAMLAQGSQADVDRQVQWLARVLSARGMPRWMVERHLEILNQELTAAVPERAADYDKFLRAAHRLAEARRAVLPDPVFQALAAEFDAAVGAEWAARLPGMGFILAAAVVDEANGVALAASSVQAWIEQSLRFPTAWIDAARHTLRKTREHVYRR